MRVGLPTRRAYVVAALLGVGALDLHATAVGLRAHTRLLAHTLSGARMATAQARPRLMAAVAAGDADAPRRAVAAALDAGIATSAEAFLTDGRRLAAQPDAAPVIPPRKAIAGVHSPAQVSWPTVRVIIRSARHILNRL